MNTFGTILYPQYRLQLEPKARFVAHLKIFNYVLCQLKKLGLDELWVPRLFSPLLLTYKDLYLSLP
jgi:hypothetical protein